VLENEEFAEAMLEVGCIYAICYTLLQPVEEVVSKLPQEYVEFMDIFLETKAVMLLPLRGPKHVIELEGSKLLYRPIYNLLE
jgi:hypothetical protein